MWVVRCNLPNQVFDHLSDKKWEWIASILTVADVAASGAFDERGLAARAPLLVTGARGHWAGTYPWVARTLAQRGTVAVLRVAALANYVCTDVLHHTHLLHDGVAGALVTEDVHLDVVRGATERDVWQVVLLHQLGCFLAADGYRVSVRTAKIVPWHLALHVRQLGVLSLVRTARALVWS